MSKKKIPSVSLEALKNVTAGAADTVAGKAKEISEKAVEVATAGAKGAVDLAQQVHHDMQVAYYNPLFPETYIAPDFDLPDMIVIEDEDTRKEIEVCEGSIGWLSKEAGIEILHLYKETVPYSGLSFFPTANCDAVYYVDPFDDKRYIDLSIYYDTLQKDKLTELRNIAHALGAQECRLEYQEEDKTIRRQNAKGEVKAKEGDLKAQGAVSGEMALSASEEKKTTILFEYKFEGSDIPTVPDLAWYAHDNNLLSLINTRCSKSNPAKEWTVQIDSKLSSTMSLKRACKIDAALKKLGAIGNFSMESEATTEARRHFLYYIRF